MDKRSTDLACGPFDYVFGGERGSVKTQSNVRKQLPSATVPWIGMTATPDPEGIWLEQEVYEIRERCQ